MNLNGFIHARVQMLRVQMLRIQTAGSGERTMTQNVSKMWYRPSLILPFYALQVAIRGPA